MKRITKTILPGIFLLIQTNGHSRQDPIITKTTNKNTERKVDSVLTLLILKEKIGQMNRYNASWDLDIIKKSFTITE